MSTLTGRSIDSTYQDLLRIENYGEGGGTTLRTIRDGLGNNLPLKLSTNSVELDTVLNLNGNKITGVDTTSILEDTNGKPLLKFLPRTDSDSFVNISNHKSTDTYGPIILTESTATNCSLNIEPKGDGKVWIVNIGFSFNASANNFKLTNLGDPVNPQDSVPKEYVNDQDELMVKTDGTRSFTDNVVSNSSISAEGYTINGQAPTYGLKNFVQNPEFKIWQRIASPYTGTGALGPDRWYCHRSGGAGFFGYSGPDYRINAKSGLVCQTTAKPTDMHIWQRIYDRALQMTAGKTVNVSFWIYSDALPSGPVTIELSQYFGTGGSVYVSTAGTYTIDQINTWEKKSVSIAVPSISGKTMGTPVDQYLFFRIYLPNALYATTGTCWISKVQLEIGAETEFEARPESVEMQLCQRFFQKSYHPSYYAGSITSLGSVNTLAVNQLLPGMATIHFKPPMYKTPATQIYSDFTGSGGYIRDRTTVSDISMFIDPTINNRSFIIWRHIEPRLTRGHDLSWHWTADAE